MRLNSIKLSGFKSFVEPTHFQLPGQLVGVVGPNGCGKSNIIDAVRWVLGESKASELRGESMQDVIFNGTNLRKPAGRASVELVVRQQPSARRRPVEPLRRDRRQARADARRHEQLSHQRPAGAPARHPGRVPRHRPRAARLRDHRPGHDLADHREQARGAAPVPRGSGGRLEVQGAPARDRDPAQGHAREPDPGRGHPARAHRQPRQARGAGRGRRPLSRDAARGAAEAASALVPEAPRRDARGGARRPGGRRGDHRARIAQRRPAPCRSRARGDPPVALRGQRRAARRAGRARPGRARGEPARGADPLRRRRSRAVAAPARRPRGAKRGVARARKRRAWPSTSGSAATPKRPSVAPRSIAADLAAHAARIAGSEEAVRAAQARSHEQRSAVATVQQQIQVLAAEARGVEERQAQAEARGERLRNEEKGLAEVEPAELEAARRAASDAEAQHAAALATVADWQARIPALDEARRDAAGRGQRREPAPRRARRAAGGAAGAAGEGAGREQAQAVARQARPRIARGPLDADPDRARLGVGARGGAARAPRRARGRPARQRARLCRRRAAVAARVLHRAGGGASVVASHLAAPGRPAPSRRRRPGGAARRLARGRLHRERLRRCARRALEPDPRRGHHDPRRPRGEPVRGRLLRARFRAGGPARARPGDREPAPADAGAGAGRRRGAQPPDSRRGREHRGRRAPGGEPARGGAAAVARPPAACRAAAPHPAGRADEPAPRAARRRARRARGRARRARRAAARRRVALRGARRRARRRPGAAGRRSTRRRSPRAARSTPRAPSCARSSTAPRRRSSSCARSRRDARSSSAQIETARQQIESNRLADAALADEHAQLDDAPAQAELQSALAARLEHEQRLGEKRSLYDDLSQRLRARRRGAPRPRAGAAAAARQGHRVAARGAGGAARRRAVPRAARGRGRRSCRDRRLDRGRRRPSRRPADEDRRA